jgi:hypothetical protein
MKHLIKFSDFLAEDFASPASTLQNTSGMGNVHPSEVFTSPIKKYKNKIISITCADHNKNICELPNGIYDGETRGHNTEIYWNFSKYIINTDCGYKNMYPIAVTISIKNNYAEILQKK